MVVPVRSFSGALGLLFLSAVVCFSCPVQAEPDERLRMRLESWMAESDDVVSDDIILSQQVLVTLYERIGYQRLWTENQNKLNATGSELLDRLEHSHFLGLTPEDYHVALIHRKLNDLSADPTGQGVDLELLLTDGYLLYLSHNDHGKVNPRTIDPDWNTTKPLSDMVTRVVDAVDNERLLDLMDSVEPTHPGYVALKAQLKRLLEQGVHSEMMLNVSLKPGVNHEQVPHLVLILQSLGYLNSSVSYSKLFDQDIRSAVMRFQRDQNLEADGVVGPQTREALQQAYAGDIDTIRVNMERWRWEPDTYSKEYIAVNIASFQLAYWRPQKTPLIMRVIVGKNYRKTPVFTDRMRYLVLHPSWNVPHKIASEDLLPKIKADRDYLSKNNMLLFRGWGSDQMLVDPAEINWGELTSKKFPFHIRQMPGPKNALGVVKFMFPNEHNVYLHDTNDRSLFERPNRAFSSGCIRLEKPLDLLFAVTEGNSPFSRQQIESLIDVNTETTVSLSRPIPVHIQYWTAWVDDNNRLHYRSDVYQRDHAVLAALNDRFQAE